MKIRKLGKSGASMVVAIIAIAVIIASVIFLAIWRDVQDPSEHVGETRTVILVCEETGEVFKVDIDITKDPPYYSKASGKNTAYVALLCQNDRQTVFPMKKTPIGANVCPVCGEARGMLFPYDPSEGAPTSESSE